MLYKSKPYLSYLSWANDWMESGMFMKWWIKTWIYAPRQHTNVPASCIMNWWNWGPRLGHLSWDRIQLFFFLQNRLLWEIIVSKKKLWSKRRTQRHQLLRKSRKNKWRRLHQEGGKTQTLSLPNTLQDQQQFYIIRISFWG